MLEELLQWAFILVIAALVVLFAYWDQKRSDGKGDSDDYKAKVDSKFSANFTDLWSRHDQQD
jgi:hypothetical protein